MVGVISAAFALPPVLALLHNTYTVGSPELVAPQATLVASVVEGVFGGTLPQGLILAGAALGAVIIAIDCALERSSRTLRLPVLAVAVGIYLPLALSVGIFIGGMIYFIAQQRRSRASSDSGAKSGEQKGVLFASGLITGEALMGIIAALIVGSGIDLSLGFSSNWLGLGLFIVLLGALCKTASDK